MFFYLLITGPLLIYLYWAARIHIALRKDSVNEVKYEGLNITQDEKALSVVVPLRNEENNISSIVSSFKNQSLGKDYWEVIFIDDHSSDDTLNALNYYSQQLPNAKIVSLPTFKSGKKMALREGVNNANGLNIVTTDGDCRHSERWLESIITHLRKTKSEFVIAPVSMEGKGIFGKLQEMEFDSIMALTLGMAKVHHPIMCNAANLVFSKNMFNRYAQNNDVLPSGDDMFLLEGLKRDGCKDKISVLYHKKAIVYTSAQKSVSDFINQRIRWASKSRYYTDRDIMLSGIIVLAANIILIVVLAMAFFEKHNLYNFFVVMGIKTFADLIILMPITRFFQRVFNPFIFSLLTIIYPFYSLFTVLASWRGTYKWKGRCIK